MITDGDTGRAGKTLVRGRVRAGASAPFRQARPHHGLGPLRRAWDRFRRNRLSVAALLAFCLVLLFSFGAPLVSRFITRQDYAAQNLAASCCVRPGGTSSAVIVTPRGIEQVQARHWLGADELGRDVLTRLAYGGRISLMVAFLALALALTIGLAIGAVAGYYGGWLDSLLMRLVDTFLAIPGLFVLILISALLNNNRLLTGSRLYREAGWLVLPLVIAILGWTGISRLVRGEFLSLKERDFIEAARVIGATDRQIMLRHILPNALPVIVVWGTLAIPSLILAEASLSYLGFGVQVPTPSWGNMLNNATEYYSRAPFLVVLPGAMIYITAMAVNLIGNGLRDAFDPRLNE